MGRDEKRAPLKTSAWETSLVKAVALLRSVNLKLSTLFVVRRCLSMSLEGRLNPVFGPRKKVSIQSEITGTKII